MRYVITFIAVLSILSCQGTAKISEDIIEDTQVSAIGDAYYETYTLEVKEDIEETTQALDIIIMQPESKEELNYPIGPYAIDKFTVLPNMSFFDPWTKEWLSLEQLYKHKEHKAFILVSSAGWCGPCIQEAAALINVYNKYNEDGLEIIYTLGNTNIPGDTPFDNNYEETDSASYKTDLEFMENWQLIVQDTADQKLNYRMYADPNREIVKHLPNHAWPLSILITTKDMGVRFVEEGFWQPLMENKIMLVLYNDVPEIPFN